MTRDDVKACIEQTGIIPAIRVHGEQEAIFAALAVFRGGIRIAEITMTIPGALDLIARIRSLQPRALIGAGTVVDADMARSCIAAGASFITSPGFDPEIAEVANHGDIVCIPGALTPTEVMLAARTPSEFIKIFPCAQVGGPSYIKALCRPFPSAHFIASGGVTQKNASDYIRAGAVALGIGEELIPSEAVRLRNESWIHELARRFLAMVKEGRVARAYAELRHNHAQESDVKTL